MFVLDGVVKHAIRSSQGALRLYRVGVGYIAWLRKPNRTLGNSVTGASQLSIGR